MKQSAILSDGVVRGDVDINECVYCGSTESLTKEHSIPLGLGGNNVLIGGSCKTCAAKTSWFEQKIMSNNLDRVREFFGIKSRHARRRGRWDGTVKLTDYHGEEHVFPNSSVPSFAAFAQWGYLPRLLTRQTKGRKHRYHSVRFCPIGHHIAPEALGLWQPQFTVNSLWWAQFIAKIAYCEYIRVIDAKFRSPKLSNFIVAGKGDMSNFVGGREDARPRIGCTTNVMHFALPRLKGGFAILTYVRVFSWMDTPSYLVYLGEVERGCKYPAPLQRLDSHDVKNVWPSYEECPPVPEQLERLMSSTTK